MELQICLIIVFGLTTLIFLVGGYRSWRQVRRDRNMYEQEIPALNNQHFEESFTCWRTKKIERVEADRLANNDYYKIWEDSPRLQRISKRIEADSAELLRKHPDFRRDLRAYLGMQKWMQKQMSPVYSITVGEDSLPRLVTEEEYQEHRRRGDR